MSDVTTDLIAVDLGVAEPAPGSTTEKQWEMWIEDAEMLIEDRRLEIGAEPIDPAKIAYAVRKAVVAHAKKPDDATTITVAVDDGSSTRRYESASGRVSVEEWWTFLGLTGESPGAFTIRPAGTPIVCDPLTW